MPRLEVLSRHPQSGVAKPHPLLFVHGAFCAAWIWNEKFLPWFAERGWDAYALSLSGHGASLGVDGRRWGTIGDYVDDVLEVVDTLDRMPVLIGHSMGGMVVQRLLLRREAPAAMLLASAPPHGLLEATVGLAWRDPFVFAQMAMLTSFGNRFINPEGIRRAMFSDSMPRDEVARYLPLLERESNAVVSEMMNWNPMPALPDRRIPIYVGGGGHDLLVPPDQVATTARMLNTETHLFEGMGHAMMIEPGWEEVAQSMHDWLEDKLGV